MISNRLLNDFHDQVEDAQNNFEKVMGRLEDLLGTKVS